MNLNNIEETTKRKTTQTQLSVIITNTVNKSEGKREPYWSLPFQPHVTTLLHSKHDCVCTRARVHIHTLPSLDLTSQVSIYLFSLLRGITLFNLNCNSNLIL